MLRSLDNQKDPIEKTANGLADVLQMDEQQILDILQATPEEIETLKADPGMCAVLNDITINAPYLFEGRKDYIKRMYGPLRTIELEALKYTPCRKESDETIKTKIARLRVQDLMTRNISPHLQEQYFIARIRLGICLYWSHSYCEMPPKRLFMMLPPQEKEEFLKAQEPLSQEEEAKFYGVVDAIRERMERVRINDMVTLVERGVDPKIAHRRVEVGAQRLLKVDLEDRDEYVSKEDLIALACDEERLQKYISLLFGNTFVQR